MEIKISFNPAVDKLADVIRAVNGAYGAGEIVPASKVYARPEQEVRVAFADGSVTTATPAGMTVAADGTVTQAYRVTAPEGVMITPAEQAEAEYLEKVAETGLDPAAAFGGNSTPGAATATAAAGTMPPAPTSSAPTSTASAAGIELDAEGLPWDKRIHSDAAERKTQKGVWKKRRGVQDAVVAQVEAELRAALAANPGAITPPAGAVEIPAGGVLGESAVHVEPAAASVDLGQPSSPVIAQPATLAPPAPAPIAQPAALTPPSPAVDPAAPSFIGLMNKVLPHMQSPANPAGPLTARHLEEIAHRCNLFNPTTGKGDINMLANRPDLLDHAYQWAEYLIANPATPMLSKG